MITSLREVLPQATTTLHVLGLVGTVKLTPLS